MAVWHWLCLGAVLATGPVAADWGERATFPGTRTAWADAVKRALKDPFTWVPAAVGTVVLASGEDEALSDRAMESATLFGTPARASERSDELRGYTDLLWITSMLITESGDRPLRNKTKGTLVQVAAVHATLATSNLLKNAIHRDEPGQHGAQLDGDAFPSNHATQPFAQAALVRRNLRATNLPPAGRAVANTTAYLLAAGTAWARVEAGIHHVSDQLLGAALGNFVALTVNDALMGETGVRLSLSPGPDGVRLGLEWRY